MISLKPTVGTSEVENFEEPADNLRSALLKRDLKTKKGGKHQLLIAVAFDPVLAGW